jgi:hypothetical protein
MPSVSKYDRLVASLRHKGVRDPRALAASIGRKKLGKEEFQRRAEEGRKQKMLDAYKKKRGIK